MPNPDNVKALYNELKNTYEIGSEEDFIKYLSDDKNREALRKELEKDYDVGDISAFTNYLGFGTGQEAYEQYMAQRNGNVHQQPVAQQQPAVIPATTHVNQSQGLWGNVMSIANGLVEGARQQQNAPRKPNKVTNEEQARINAQAAVPRAPMSSYGQQVAEQRRRQEVGKYDKNVQPYDPSKGLGYTYSTGEGYNPEIREEPSSGSNNISNVQPYDPSKGLGYTYSTGEGYNHNMSEEQVKDRQELDAPLQERFRNNVLGILNEPEMKDALERAAEEVWKESKERAYKEENYSLSNNRANTARTRNASPSVNKEYLYEKFIQGWNNHTGDKTVGMNLERRIYEELVNRYPSELYPEVSNSMLHEEAENIVKNLMYETMYTKLYEKRKPRNGFEFVVDKALSSTVPVMLMDASNRIATNGQYIDVQAAGQQAIDDYAENHWLLDKIGTVGGFVFDPTTYVGGFLGKGAVKGLMNIAGKKLGRVAAEEFAQRRIGKYLTGAINSGVSLGFINTAQEAANQARWGGVFEGYDENGAPIISNPSVGRVATSGLEGLGLGAVTGMTGGWLRNVGTKYAKLTDNVAGKGIIRGTSDAMNVLASGTIFEIPQAVRTWIKYDEMIASLSDPNSENYIADDAQRSKKIEELKEKRGEDIFDEWGENVATMAAFHLEGKFKTAPQRLREMAGRTGDRAFDRAGFASRMKMMLDGREPNLALTKEEKEELNRRGYTDLNGLVDEYKNYVENGEAGEGADIPYNRFIELMQDKNVSEAARAKLYYYITGKMLPMSTIMASSPVEEVKDANGNVTGYNVKSYGANGVITSRTYKSLREAEAEQKRIERQVELNSAVVGERYYDQKSFDDMLRDACAVVAERRGVTPEALYNFAKREPSTDVEREWMDEIAKEVKSLDENSYGTQDLQKYINAKYKVDINDVIGKEPNRRNENEKKAFREYMETLFADVKQESDTQQQRGYDADEQQRSDIAKEASEGKEGAEEAWRGVQQRINDDADMQAAEQREEAKQRQQADGSLHPATLKENNADGTPKEVYIVEGKVVTNEDGTIDVDATIAANGVGTIAIYDESTGTRREISPEELSSLGEVTTAEQQEQNIEANKQAYIQQQMDSASGKLDVGSDITLPDGTNGIIVSMDGENAVVTYIDANGEQKLTSLPVAELQTIADEQRKAEYNERHPEAVENAAPEAPEAAEQTPSKIEGVPEEFVPGMTLTVLDREGNEHTVTTDGKRYTYNPMSGELTESENGNYLKMTDENGEVLTYDLSGRGYGSAQEIKDYEMPKEEQKDAWDEYWKKNGIPFNEEQPTETVEPTEPPTAEVPTRKGHKQIERAKKDLAEADDALAKANAIQNFWMNVDAGAEATEEEKAAFDNAKKELEADGYEIYDLKGKDYNEGMRGDFDFVIDESLPTGTRKITRVSKPLVFKDGKMVQAPKATVTQSLFEDEADVNKAIEAARGGNADAQATLDRMGIEWKPTNPMEAPMPMRKVTVGKGKDKQEVDEPDFMATTAERGHHYIYNEKGYPREVADEMVQTRHSSASKTLDELTKSEPKMSDSNIGGSMALYDKIHGEWQAKKEAAEQEVKYWEDVMAEQQKAIAAEQAALKAQQQAQKEAEQGVPDMSVDKAADARRRGYRVSMGNRFDRQEPVQGVTGSETEIKFSDNDKVKGTWKVVESQQVQPSHMRGQRNPLHFITEAQPKDRTDDVSDTTSDKIAKNINPKEITEGVTAYVGAPIINSRGEVVQGNNRAIALKKMAGYPESAAKYKQYLIDHAAEFGLNADEIAKMENPVLVREADVTDDEAIRLGQFTANDTESGGKQRMSAGNILGQLDEQKTKSLFNLLLETGESEEDMTLDQIIDRNGTKVMTWLNRNGVINATQTQSAYDSKGHMTPEARNDLKDLITHHIFKGGSDAIGEAWGKLHVAAQKALAVAMAGDLQLKPEDRLLPYVQNAIMATAEIKGSPFAKDANGKEPKTAEEWRRVIETMNGQTDMYQPVPIKERYNELELDMAVKFLTVKQKALQAIFEDHQRYITGGKKQTAQTDMFGNSEEVEQPMSNEEAIEKAFGVKLNTDNNGNIRRTTGGVEAGGEARGGNVGLGEGRAEAAEGGQPGAAAEQPAGEVAANPDYKPKSERELLEQDKAMLEKNIAKFEKELASNDPMDKVNHSWDRQQLDYSKKRLAKIDKRLAELDAAEQPKQQKTGGEATKTSERDRRLLEVVMDKLRKIIGDRLHTTLTEDEKGLINWARAAYHRVFHGSGALLKKKDGSYVDPETGERLGFDSAFMGTGEGNQAYGNGHYTTEVEGIGRTYAENAAKVWFHDKDSGYDVDVDEVRDEWEDSDKRSALIRVFENARRNNFDMEAAIADAIEEVEGRESYEGELEFLRQLTADDFEQDRVLYTVEIPDDNGSNYLEWDKPASMAQVIAIKNALIENKKFVEDGKKAYDFHFKNYNADEVPPFEEWIENHAIVVARGAESNGERLYKELTGELGSEKAASELLHDAGLVGIKYPAQFRSGGREDGASNYVIFDDGDLKITDKIKFFKTPQGEVYGFTVGGNIYVDMDIAKADTPIHEYGHLWVPMVRESDPEMWEDIKRVLTKDKDVKPFMDIVRQRYPELTAEGREDDFMEEVFTHFSGDNGLKMLEEAAREYEEQDGQGFISKAKAIAALNKVKEALERFWGKVAQLFGIKFRNAREVANKMMKDFMDEVDPTKVRTERIKNKGLKPEEEKTLMGVHNISEEKLRKALKNGGFANPSMAVIDTRNGGFDSYGDISLIPKASLIDARTGRNAGTWAGDAWTPTYPSVSTHITDKGHKHIEQIAKDASDGNSGMRSHIWSRLESFIEDKSDRLHYLFLKQTGREPEILGEKTEHSHEEYEELEKIFGKGFKWTDSQLTDEQHDALLQIMMGDIEQMAEDNTSNINDPEQREKARQYLINSHRKSLLDENGKMWFAKWNNYVYEVLKDEERRQNPRIDYYGTDLAAQKRVNNEGLTDEYEQWKANLLDEGDSEEKLFAGFTPSGNRRYLPNTVENASKLMNKHGDANAYDSHGLNATKATLLKRMRSLADIRRHRELLKGEEEYNESQKRMSDELFDIISQISDLQKISDNQFSNVDYAESRLQEAITKRDPIDHLNKEYGYHIAKDSDLASQIMNFIEEAKRMPAKYFETKFKRPVALDEFAVAVVPEGTSQDVVDALKNAGLDVRTYDGTSENRQAVTLDAVKGRDDIMFQKADNKSTEREVEPYKAPKKNDGEDLIDYAKRVAEDYSNHEDKKKNSNGGIEQAVESAKATAEENKGEADKLKADYEAIGGKLADLRKAMSLQKKFDAGTVKRVSDLAKEMMDGGMLDELRANEIERLLSSVYNGGENVDIEDNIRRVVELMIDNQKMNSENVNGGNGGGNGGNVTSNIDDVPRAVARDSYERMMNSGANQFKEAVQDSMLSLKKLYEAILGKGTKIEDVEGYKNAYLAENRMHSTSQAEIGMWHKDFMEPVVKAIHELTGGKREAYDDLVKYMMAKHGLERNAVFAERDAQAAAKKGADYDDELNKNSGRDYAGLTALTGENDVATAEAMAQKMVDDYEANHDTTELWNAINRATNQSLWKLASAGMMTPERYNEIRDMFNYYIPLQGFDETVAENVYSYMGNDGTLGYGTPIRHARGRKSLADDPIATMAMNGEAAIRQANRNEMKKRFLAFAQEHPSDLVSVSEVWLKHNDVTGEWEQVTADLNENDSPADVERKTREFDDKMEQLASNDPDHYKKASDIPNVPFRVVEPSDMKQHQVLVQRGGKKYMLTINGNPRAAQALNGLTNPDVFTEGVFGKAMNLGQWLNRQLSAFYTTRNPEFVLSNFLRDAIYSNSMSWVKESPSYALKFHKNFGKMNPVHMGKLFAEWENGKLRERINNGTASETEQLFYDFMANGGETGWTSLRDIEKHKKELQNSLKREGSTSRKVWKALGTAFDLMNRSVENCARFAAFVTSREMGRSIDRSINDAKEVSVNFNKKGAGDKFLTSKNQNLLGKVGASMGGLGRGLYVFFNASMQGLNNIARATKRHPGKAAGLYSTLFALGALAPILAEVLSGGDDDDDKNSYYNLPEYIRRSNICFRFGKDMPWITIPLPIEFRAIYGLGELSTGALTGKEHYTDEEFAKQYVSQLSQVLPLDFMEGGGGWHAFVPSMLKPYVEAQSNTSWTGLPIYRDNKFKPYDPEWTRAYSSANKQLVNATKWLNEATGGDDVTKGFIDWNPAKIEYLLKGYLGGYFTMYDRLQKTAETALGDRDFEWRNIPMASRVLREGDERTEARKLTNEYFNLLDEYNETKHKVKEYEKISKSDREDAIKYAQKLAYLNYSDEYTRYMLMEYYKPILDKYNEMSKEADGEDAKRIKDEENAMRRELINIIHSIDKGEEIDVNAAIDEMLMGILNDEQKDISLRKKAQSTIKKHKKEMAANQQ